MTSETVGRGMLLRQNVHTDPQGGHGGVKLRPEKVGQIEAAAGIPDHHRPPCVHMGYALSSQIVAYKYSAAVRVPFQRLPVQTGIYLSRVRRRTEKLRRLPQDGDPGVGISGTVIAVNHCHRLARRRGHKINLLMDPLQGPLQNHHGKNGGSRGYIPRTGRHSVGGGHTGTRVTLGRSKGNAGRQQTIQQRGSLLCQRSRPFSRCQYSGQDVPQLPGKSVLRHKAVKLLLQTPGEALRGQDFIELPDHALMEGPAGAVHREHAGGFPGSDGVHAGQLVVNKPGQRSNMRDFSNMRLPIQHRLI